MQPKRSDTTREALLVRDAVLRRLGAAGRASMTFELGDNLRSLVEAGARSRCGERDPTRVRREVLRLMVGDALLQRLLPCLSLP